MLKVDKISVEYDGKRVLEDFSLELGAGQVACLVGESGSGKTTVIRSILGLLPEGGEVTQGDILFDGRSLLSSGGYAESLRGRDITMIFQDSGAMIDPVSTIGRQFVEYIRTQDRKAGKREAQARAINMLRQMRLPDPENVMHSYPFQLSGGMRQRVGIAMAMCFEPRLLLADEPTSALDVTTQAQIVRQMMELHTERRTSIILVTHNLGVAAYMSGPSDKIIVMKSGRIVEQGSREKILRCPAQDYTRELLAAIPTMEGEGSGQKYVYA